MQVHTQSLGNNGKQSWPTFRTQLAGHRFLRSPICRIIRQTMRRARPTHRLRLHRYTILHMMIRSSQQRQTAIFGLEPMRGAKS